MSTEPLSDGWRSTDEVSVPVRSVSEQTKVKPRMPTKSTPALSPSLPSLRAEPEERHMQFSALLGVVIVLILTALYLGLGTDLFRGELLDEFGHVITITADGNFSPSSLTAMAGETISIENKNPDPQVLKSRNNRDLFAVQVLFEKPFTFTIPNDAIGPYVYGSETLPEDQTFTITVLQGNTVTASTVDESESFDIPLPFGDGPVRRSPERTTRFSSSSIASSISDAEVSIEQKRNLPGTAHINLGTSGLSSSTAYGARPTIEENPFTVALGKEKQSLLERKSVFQNQKSLHGGAPLQSIKKPRQVTETGPRGMLLLLVPAFLGVLFMAQRKVR